MPLSKLQNGAKHTYSQVLVYMKAFEFKVFLKNEKITLLGGGGLMLQHWESGTNMRKDLTTYKHIIKWQTRILLNLLYLLQYFSYC